MLISLAFPLLYMEYGVLAAHALYDIVDSTWERYKQQKEQVQIWNLLFLKEICPVGETLRKGE